MNLRLNLIRKVPFRHTGLKACPRENAGSIKNHKV
jgi:hypothetical protein